MKKNNLLDVCMASMKDFVANTVSVGDDLKLIDLLNLPDAMFEPFRTHHTTAVFFFDGEYDVSVNMQRFHLQAPCLLQLLSDETVQYHSATPHPNATCIILSRGATNGLIPNQSDKFAFYRSVLENPVVPFADDYRPTMELFIASVREVLRHADNPNRLEAARNLIRAFFLSMPQFKKAPQIAQSHKDELMFRFLNVLRENFRSERTIEFYAKSLSLSPKHLSKVVKQASGRTVHDWVDEYVITEAKALLREGTMSVKQVSDKLNFPSQSMFGRFFKKMTGYSPKQYMLL
jgi:AraC-like DNA-binding protein